MNVTVHVPSALRNAVEGRRKLNFGMPPSSDVGDLVQTLLTLYPKLRAHVPHDNKANKVQMRVLADARLKRVYLVADQARRLAV